MSQQPNSALHKFAVTTSAFTVLLLMAGALVTSNDAADSVPDWPLAYGKIIPPLVGGIRYEFTHRVVAGIVSVLTLILAIWLTSSDKRPSIRRLGWAAVALVIAQALLGAARVLLGHPPLIATVHATIAQIFFITTVALALATSSWSVSEHPTQDDPGSPKLRALALCTTLVILLQLVLGAGFRHGAFGILPHLIGAVAVTFFVIWTTRIAKKRFASTREIRTSIKWLNATFGTQILLGFAAYWAVAKAIDEVQPTPSYVILTVAHVLVGALTLASSVILTLICYRLLRPSGAAQLTSQASRAAV